MDLEMNSELSIVSQKNDLLEKKSFFVERQKEVNALKVQLFEQCSSQVQQMNSANKSKLRAMNEGLEKLSSDVRKLSEHCISSLDTTFKKLDLNKPNREHRVGLTDAPLKTSLDKLIQAETEILQNGQAVREKFAGEEEELTKQQENLNRQNGEMLKQLARAEKENGALKEQFHVQRRISVQREENVELAKARANNSEEVKNNAKAQDEIVAAEKSREELMKLVEQNEQMQNDIARMDSASTSHVLEVFPENLEIQKILEEWQKISQSAAQPLLDNIELSESETLENLTALHKKIKKEKNAVIAENEKKMALADRYTVAQETLRRKISGIDAIRQQISNGKVTLAELKVGDDDEEKKQKQKEALRTLKESRNDVPKFPQFQSFDEQNYVTPRISATEPAGKPQKLSKRNSVESDATRPLNLAGQPYPGIQLLSQDENNSSLRDDSDFTFDDDPNESGNTQNTSVVNNFFGNLDGESPKKFEFSMADHMKEFDKRQAPKRTAAAPSDVAVKRINTAEISDEEDANDSIFFAPKRATESDDSDDDLAATDGVDLDQSDWGDDF